VSRVNSSVVAVGLKIKYTGMSAMTSKKGVKMKTIKLEPGDLVECVDKKDSFINGINAGGAGWGWEKGLQFTVIKATNETDEKSEDRLCWGGKNGNGVYHTHLKLIKKGPKMGRALAEYPSKSSPGKKYTVMEPDGGGEFYCDCWQWKKTRTCSHIKQYVASMGVPVEAVSAKVEESGVIDSELDTIISSFF